MDKIYETHEYTRTHTDRHTHTYTQTDTSGERRDAHTWRIKPDTFATPISQYAKPCAFALSWLEMLSVEASVDNECVTSPDRCPQGLDLRLVCSTQLLVHWDYGVRSSNAHKFLPCPLSGSPSV